ncbi:hypothetical protein [Corynebacterium vitaeruminis]|uniref:Gp37-like protein n=1 Tax=Corynebacterium vitaeruminis TaxID=38305 RepID=UPI0023F4FAAA|nr:hypothetical protein [Corynebacterium vitaeruminis]
MEATGQYVGVLDRDWQPGPDIEDWDQATWGGVYDDTGSMSLTLPGTLPDGSVNPIARWFMSADVSDFSDASSLDQLFHESVHVMVERPAGAGKVARRVFRVLQIVPSGGNRVHPDFVTVTGVDMVEHLKHMPQWADPSNHSHIAQLQFSDVQTGSVEQVSRKLIGRNLMGYQQPSMLNQPFDGKIGAWSMTGDYSDPARWVSFQPNMHSVICSPIVSGLDSEYCVVEARWDNAWDLLIASWRAGGVMVTVDLWLPGDEQPFPTHTTLQLPTAIVDFHPRSTVSGAVGLIGQAWRNIKRVIDEDGISSAIQFADQGIPGADGRQPWVVYDLPEGPEVTISKSTDNTFLVGGKSPKIVNEIIKAGIKTAISSLVSLIPGVGPAAAALINGAGEVLAAMSVDRFLNINEFTDEQRKTWHGRSSYISLSKTGAANSLEALQKAWQAKEETDGGISVGFKVDSVEPYVPHRDFEIGDTIGFVAWGQVWAAYVSEITWTSSPGEPVGFELKLGNPKDLKDPVALLQQSAEATRSVLSRLATEVSN